MMDEALEHLVKGIVDNPDEVVVKEKSATCEGSLVFWVGRKNSKDAFRKNANKTWSKNIDISKMNFKHTREIKTDMDFAKEFISILNNFDKDIVAKIDIINDPTFLNLIPTRRDLGMLYVLERRRRVLKFSL